MITTSFFFMKIMQIVFVLFFKKLFLFAARQLGQCYISFWDCTFLLLPLCVTHQTTICHIMMIISSHSDEHSSSHFVRRFVTLQKETKIRAFTRYSEQGSRVVAHHLSVPNFYRRASWRTAGRNPCASTCRSATGPRRRCAAKARSCSGLWSREPVNPSSPVRWQIYFELPCVKECGLYAI